MTVQHVRHNGRSHRQGIQLPLLMVRALGLPGFAPELMFRTLSNHPETCHPQRHPHSDTWRRYHEVNVTLSTANVTLPTTNVTLGPPISPSAFTPNRQRG
jgi:hypothetical protein